MTADSTGNAFVAFDSNGSNSLASGSIEQFSASNYSAGTTVLANLENLTDEQVAGMTTDRGGTGSLVLEFQNTGNATASRSVSLTIVATPLGGVEPSDTLFTEQVKLRIPDNRAGVRMRLKFKLSTQAQGLQDLMTVTVQGTTTISTSNSILLGIGPEIAG